MVSVPDLLKQCIPTALMNELLQFTRDDDNNRWALAYQEHIFRAPVFTSVADDDNMWFPYFPQNDSRLDVATHFNNLQAQAGSVGILIPSDDPRCFRAMTIDGERAANK